MCLCSGDARIPLTALKLRMRWLMSLTALTLLPILISIRNRDVGRWGGEGGSGAREGGQRAQEAYSGFVSWNDRPTAEQAAGTPQRRDVFSKINSRACKNRTMNVPLWLDMLLFLSSTSVASHPCSAVYNASTCRKSGVTSFPVVAAWLLCTINSGSAEPRACSLHMPCCVAAA